MGTQNLYLGIDYGGTAAKMGVVDEAGNLIGSTRIDTIARLNEAVCDAFADDAARFVHELGVEIPALAGIGLAVPGVVVADKPMFVPNVRVDWTQFVASLACTFPKSKIALVNDANAAALGETWRGVAAQASSALFVVIGTGLGAGMVVDGKVIVGNSGAAGEIGHMTVEPDGRKCNCGRTGCLEQYASARGIVKSFREADAFEEIDRALFADCTLEGDTDARTVCEAYRAGDPRAQYALSVFAERLGFALAQVACAIDPSIIVLGGGVTRSADLFFDALKSYFDKYCLSSCASTDIMCAALSSEAGVYGAARYAMLRALDE